MKIYLMMCGSLMRILGFKRKEEHSHKLRLRGGGIDKHWVNPTMNARYSEEASFDTHTTQLILKFVCYYLPTICAKLLKQR